MLKGEHGNPKLAIRYAKRIIEEGKGKTPTEIAPGTRVYVNAGIALVSDRRSTCTNTIEHKNKTR